MHITYTSKRWRPDMILDRYVRRDPMSDIYHFCEVEPGRYDLRQGTAEASEISDDVRAAADARRGYWPAYVPWPQ